jgi:putative ABC transport system permease protein
MARRDISRHKGRSLLIVLLIMLPVAGMTGAATLYQSSLRTPDEIVRYELGNTQARFGALPLPNGDSVQDPQNDMMIISSTGIADPDFLPADPGDVLPPGYQVLPVRQAQLTTSVGAALVSLQGVEADALNEAFAGKFTLLEGRGPEADKEVLVSPGLLDRFDLDFGEEFTTSAGTFVPVGTIRDADASDGNSVLYLQSGQAAEGFSQGPVSPQAVSYYLVGPEPITWQQVRDANSRGVGVLSRSVVLDPPPVDQQVVPGAPPRSPGSAVVAAYATYGLVGALAMLEVGLLAGAAFSVGAKRQVRELALLAASGAETPTVRAVVTAGGLWLGTIAVAAGATVGLGSAAAVVHYVRSTGSARLAGLHPDLLLMGIAMVMGLGACILAALAPAHQVARQAVVGALKSGRAPAGNGKRTSIAGALLLVAAAGLLAAGWLLGQTDDPDQRAEQLPLVTTLLIAGAVLAVVALVLMAGRIVLLLTPRAQRLPLPLRMAARDSARNRGRTVPAVAAVLAAATLAGAGLVLSASQQAGLRESHTWTGLENQTVLPLLMGGPRLADGTVPPPVVTDPARLASAVSAALGTVEWTQVLTAAGGLHGCADGTPKGTSPVPAVTANCLAYSLARPEGNECPVTAGGRVQDPKDWRCRGAMAQDMGFRQSLLVGGADEIRAALGREAGPEALAVLEAGGMLVTNPVFVRDEKVVLEGRDVRSQWYTPSSDPSTRPKPHTSVALPAQVFEPAVAVPYYGIVSPETAERLDLRPTPAGLLVQLSEYPSAADVDAASAAASGVYGEPLGFFPVEPGISDGDLWMSWSIVAASALITLSAAGITTGLALANARTDHATLAGVGASPRLRKALAGAQALFTSGLGAVLGTLAGAVPAVLIAASTDMRTAVEVPWLQLLALVVAVPVTGSALAWLFTRAALPMSRRGLAA